MPARISPQDRRGWLGVAIDPAWADEEATRTGKPARRFRDVRWSTLDGWSRRRRVVVKDE